MLLRYLLIVGLSMGRAGSVLDPARTWFTGIGWKEEGLEIDRRRQSVESVLGSGGAWVGSVGGEHCRSCKMSSESAKESVGVCKNIIGICKKLTRFCIELSKICTKITEICWDLAGSS